MNYEIILEAEGYTSFGSRYFWAISLSTLLVSLQVTLKIGFRTTEENDASNRISFCCLQIFCSLHIKYEKIHGFQCANFKKIKLFLGVI